MWSMVLLNFRQRHRYFDYLAVAQHAELHVVAHLMLVQSVEEIVDFNNGLAIEICHTQRTSRIETKAFHILRFDAGF